MKPTSAEINLLRTKPHSTKLWLSVYQPSTVLACRVNDVSISKGEREITFDTVSDGSYVSVEGGMVMLVGTTLGGDEKGRIRVRSASSTVITVAENSHINWANNDYLTILNFFEITAVYPRIIQDPADEEVTLWYKDYDIEYTDQNDILGTFINMGPHHAEFLDGGSAEVYYSASGTFNLLSEALSYHWWFDGADSTGSSVHTPGNVSYSSPGHYTTRLTVTGSTSGASDVAYRHVSIYDKPEDGTDNPILKWEMSELSGNRDKGGYTTRIRVFDAVPESVVRPGSLIVIFAEDEYGDTSQSIGGNALNRSSIVFVGYVLKGTIHYNYRDSFVEFDAGSPTEVMKQAEGFSISVRDSDDPSADVVSDDDIPSGWTVVLDMDMRRALYHYLRWQSTVLLCNDFEFLGQDKAIEYFDADRESLYDAINTGMSSTLLGKVVSDRQGKVWAESPVWAEPSEYDEGLSLNKKDWIDEPIFDERMENEVSFVEMGGVAYSGDATGTFSALLSAAPGTAPSYRGEIERIQGLALLGQTQLNEFSGDLYAYRNSEYPNVRFKLSGNYRNYDIAPQEKVPVTLSADDTVRGISFTDKDFFVNALNFSYNGENALLSPTMEISEVTSGFDGDTMEIPDTPPTEGEDGGGYDIPPIIVPPIPTPTIPGEGVRHGFLPLDNRGDYDNIEGLHGAWDLPASGRYGVSGGEITPNGFSSILLHVLGECIGTDAWDISLRFQVYLMDIGISDTFYSSITLDYQLENPFLCDGGTPVQHVNSAVSIPNVPGTMVWVNVLRWAGEYGDDDYPLKYAINGVHLLYI